MMYRSPGGRASRTWDLALEDPDAPTLVVQLHWGDTCLRVEHLSPPRELAIAHPLGSPNAPRVRVGGGGVVVDVPEGARTTADLGNGLLPVDDRETTVTLALGDRVSIEVDAFTIEIGLVPKGRAAPRLPRPGHGLPSLLLSLALHTLLILGLSSRPVAVAEDEAGIDRETQRFIIDAMTKARGEDHWLDEMPAITPGRYGCKPGPPFWYYALDQSPEKRTAIAYGERIGALGALRFALGCPPNDFRDDGWHTLDCASFSSSKDPYAFAVEAGATPRYWVDEITLRPIGGHTPPAPPRRRSGRKTRSFLATVLEPDDAAIRRVVRARAKQLELCFQNGPYDAMVSSTFAVDADGRVSGLANDPPPRFAACLDAAVAATTFFPRAAPVAVQLTLGFPDD